jgi:hypothetical protein
MWVRSQVLGNLPPTIHGDYTPVLASEMTSTEGSYFSPGAGIPPESNSCLPHPLKRAHIGEHTFFVRHLGQVHCVLFLR